MMVDVAEPITCLQCLAQELSVCEHCDGHGWLEGWLVATEGSIERCDACETFANDDAARVAWTARRKALSEALIRDALKDVMGTPMTVENRAAVLRTVEACLQSLKERDLIKPDVDVRIEHDTVHIVWKNPPFSTT
jgi:hypothetical protein